MLEIRNKVFIINSVSSRGLELKPIIKKLFPDAPIEETKYRGHATRLAYRYSKPNTIIYAVGGDGTINEVVNGMCGENVILGIIRAGSGNDYIKNFTDETDPEKILISEKEKPFIGYDTIDLGFIRTPNHSGFFVNVATIGGLDAEIGDYTNKSVGTGEKSEKRYQSNILTNLLKFEHKEAKIRFEQKGMRKEITILAVCNGTHYGGKYNIAPNASLSDGLFDVCIVDKISKFKIPFLIPELQKGTHVSKGHPFVNMYNTSYIKVEFSEEVPCNMDGEVIRDSEFEIANVRNALKVKKYNM